MSFPQHRLNSHIWQIVQMFAPHHVPAAACAAPLLVRCMRSPNPIVWAAKNVPSLLLTLIYERIGHDGNYMEMTSCLLRIVASPFQHDSAIGPSFLEIFMARRWIHPTLMYSQAALVNRADIMEWCFRNAHPIEWLPTTTPFENVAAWAHSRGAFIKLLPTPALIESLTIGRLTTMRPFLDINLNLLTMAVQYMRRDIVTHLIISGSVKIPPNTEFNIDHSKLMTVHWQDINKMRDIVNISPIDLLSRAIVDDMYDEVKKILLEHASNMIVPIVDTIFELYEIEYFNLRFTDPFVQYGPRNIAIDKPASHDEAPLNDSLKGKGSLICHAAGARVFERTNKYVSLLYEHLLENTDVPDDIIDDVLLTFGPKDSDDVWFEYFMNINTLRPFEWLHTIDNLSEDKFVKTAIRLGKIPMIKWALSWNYNWTMNMTDRLIEQGNIPMLRWYLTSGLPVTPNIWRAVCDLPTYRTLCHHFNNYIAKPGKRGLAETTVRAIKAAQSMHFDTMKANAHRDNNLDFYQYLQDINPSFAK